jgi:hypothetical protein
MAKKKKNTGNVTSTTETNSFLKGMNKDVNASFQPKQTWFHAINAYNNSADGDAGVIGNEPANLQCAEIPYPIIGTIYKQGDQWYIFSTDDVSSEIGLLDDSKCEYTTIINDPCLNFNRKHLISGAAKENYDCTWQVYWDDNSNPSRTLNVDNIPWIQVEVQPPGAACIEYANIDSLDCEKIRLAPLMQTPCLELTKDIDGGLIRNGSYQAYIAYVVNEQRVTDYIGVSNIQSLFIHEDVGGSLNIKLTNLDRDFEYYELVVLSNAKEQVVAKKIGIYSTSQNSVSIDFIDAALISIPLEQLFGRSPAYEKSESMYVVNDYLIRQGPTEQFDFNYQPFANQIETKWQVIQYPSDYYFKGGNNTSFMRDEQYAFFIRWIYNTGERSASYHIPGRVAKVGGFSGNGQTNGPPFDSGNEKDITQSNNNLNTSEENWQVYNTAEITSVFNPPLPLDDGGVILSEGRMGYWESTERYPATKPEIWDASFNAPNIFNSTDPAHDLCGKNIRHHKMPSEEIGPSLKLSTENGQFIRILGVKFSNIRKPLYNNGLVIPNVVGYEILRGSREGAKSIMAKGIFKNMRKYNIPNEENVINKRVQGLYPNYPYNDLRDDIFFHDGTGATGKRTEGLQAYKESVYSNGANYAPPLKGYTKDVFTFHTPELPFRKPYLNAYETRIYGKYKGLATGYFTKSEDHPGEKLLLNYPIVYAAILGIGYALTQFKGKENKKNLPLQFVHLNPYLAIPQYRPILDQSTSQYYYKLDNKDDADRYLEQPGADPIKSPGATASYDPFINATGFFNLFDELISDFQDIGDIVTGGTVSEGAQKDLNTKNYTAIKNHGGTTGGGIEIEFEGSDFKSLPNVLRLIMSVPGFLVHTAQGANVLIDLFYNIMSYQDYALKHNSHGFYTTLDPLNGEQFRSRNIASNYLGSSFNIFGEANNKLYKVNNLFRPDTIAINTKNEFQDPEPEVDDLSRYSLGQIEEEDGEVAIHKSYQGRKFKKPICALYGALKFKIDNQYGQIEGIKQTPMRSCVQFINLNQPPTYTFETDSILGGDVYINRYTEKTIMPIFTDFLYGQPDGYVYNYLKYTNIPYPRYWMNTERYDFTKVFNVFGSIFNSLSTTQANQWFSILPSDLYSIDVPDPNMDPALFATVDFLSGGIASLATQSLFAVTNGAMYTHINGVQDFFVESELNIAQRDWKTPPDKRHYDPYLYNNVADLFHAKIQKEDNFYLYDYSLSASRFITNLTSFGVVQPRDYDPQIAETCFTSYPKRLIYSLRAQEEAKKDFWRVFLPNNYKDFKNKVSVIKPVNQTGALMFFPYASPKMFMGVDQLQTDLGTKVILGDGGLFARDPQNITNSDMANEYASCESARSVINTPMGIFFISQAQGKIFQYSGKLVAISDKGMKWWFNKYLPSVLLRQFPELEGTELYDNPVVGIGCQAIYDINDDIVYFTKKDYSVKEEYVGQIIFDPFLCQFELLYSGTRFPVQLGDETYFDDASWTVSYDPKIRGWISFHDWHPEFVLPSINHFLTTKTFVSDKPLCPPNYSLVNGVCQKTLNETAPGFVINYEEDANINFNVNPIECDCPPGYTIVYPDITSNPVIWTLPTGDCETNKLVNTGGPGNGSPTLGSLECPIDLVFVVQADDSTSVDDLHIPDQQVILTNYIRQFLLNGDIANAINNQNMQIGVRLFGKDSGSPGCVSNTQIDYSAGRDATLDFAFPGTPEFMASSDPLTGQDNISLSNGIFNWMNQGGAVPTWLGNRAFASFSWGVDYGQRGAIQDIIGGNSQLGNRSADPNYKAIVFHVTGLVNFWNAFGPDPCFNSGNIAQANLSNNQVLGGQNNQIYSLAAYIPYDYDFLTGAYNPASGLVIGPLTANTSHNFKINQITNPLDFTSDIINVVNKIKDICTPQDNLCNCRDYTLTILDTASLDQYDILYQKCVTGSYETQLVQKGQTVTIPCVRENSVSIVQGIGAAFFSLTTGVLCDIQYNCDSGPTSAPEITSYQAICRKIECGCPPSSLPNATLNQDGDCSDINDLVYLVGDTVTPFIIPPDLISCEYESLLQVPPSFERGTLWRHNYRCDLYANYYGQDYPWEIELVENTGQMVTTIRSFEYQMEAYVYNGDLHNGCGDDRWHDLDFNFDKAIIYNSEQVSGLLTLVPHPKEDPLNMIIYPIIGAQDIQILYSKEEQKYRFNQFWDITRDRGEFTSQYVPQPGIPPFANTGENIFVTELNGYIKDLNFNNLLYQKSSSQRKKFRHYFNKVILRRTLSGDRKMLLKLNNTKLNLSIR